jgi:hypothetical protein
MSDIVKFEFDQPIEVALKYPDPRIFENQWGGERSMYSLTDGRVMYLDSIGAARIKSLGVQPGELFFVVKRKNGRLTDYAAFREGQEPPAPDQRWSAPAAPKAKPAYKTPDLVASVAARNAAANGEPSDLERQLAQSIDMAERRKLDARLNQHIDAPAANGNGTKPYAEKGEVIRNMSEKGEVINGNGTPRKPAAWAETLLSQTNQLVDTYASALQHASQHGIGVKPEDVRSLLVTAFINLSKKAAA